MFGGIPSAITAFNAETLKTKIASVL